MDRLLNDITFFCSGITIGICWVTWLRGRNSRLSFLTEREVERLATEVATKAAQEEVTAITRVRIQRTVQEMLVILDKHSRNKQEAK